MKIVKCTEEYWGYVHYLRNLYRELFKDHKVIPLADHIDFMKKHSANYRILLVRGNPAGFVGVVNNDIRIAVDPARRNMGYGKVMLEHIKNEFPEATAQILASNIPSQKLFASCGIPYKVINDEAQVV